MTLAWIACSFVAGLFVGAGIRGWVGTEVTSLRAWLETELAAIKAKVSKL